MHTASDRDRRIEILARRQHGVFNHEQALAAGFDDHAIHRRLACGAWIRLARGVYALASSVLSPWRQYKAAQLSVPGAALSGLAAARLHEFCDFPVVRAEISVLLARTHRTRLATVHRWTIPPKSTTVRGIRVTPIAQTLLDIALRIDELRLERTMDDSLLTGRVAITALTERLNAYEDSRRPG